MSLSEEELQKIVAEVAKPVPPYRRFRRAGVRHCRRGCGRREEERSRLSGPGPGGARKDNCRHARSLPRHARRWAEMAVAETGMGRVEDKVVKNMVCIDRTPGVEDLRAVAYTGDKGLTLVEYAPFGVVAAITPSTDAVATIISNAIGILAAGNSVVFSPHPAAKGCVADAVRVLDKAIVAAGGPANLVCTMGKPTQEDQTAFVPSRHQHEHRDRRPGHSKSGHDFGQAL